MKIWLDDLRPAPAGFVWCHSVNEAQKTIMESETLQAIERIDCDHDFRRLCRRRRRRDQTFRLVIGEKNAVSRRIAYSESRRAGKYAAEVAKILERERLL